MTKNERTELKALRAEVESLREQISGLSAALVQALANQVQYVPYVPYVPPPQPYPWWQPTVTYTASSTSFFGDGAKPSGVLEVG